MNLTRNNILHISHYANPGFLDSLVEALNKHLDGYGINTLLRLKHFLGQAAEESDGFKTMHEYASGYEYEGRADLGNNQPGDGVKYKGAGIFELTGRANYAKYGEILGIDLVNHPELAQTPDVAVLTACEFWNAHNLNSYADNDDILTITRRINGGTNGFASRQTYVNLAGLVIAGNPDILSTPVVETPTSPISAPAIVVVTPTPVATIVPDKVKITPPTIKTPIIIPDKENEGIVDKVEDKIESFFYGEKDKD